MLPVFILILAYLIKSGDFDGEKLYRLRGIGPEAVRMLKLFGVLAPIMALYAVLVHPEMLFSFIKAKPKIYAMVMVLYPILSAYPQEVIYRAFLFHRYESLFPDRRGMVAVSALAFGFAHIILLNSLAVIFSTVGGLLFAYTYSRSNSVILATAEHALYGCFLFTIGLGRFFYHGAVS
jgi:membrane protease YdiL (CAAX protease family)